MVCFLVHIKLPYAIWSGHLYGHTKPFHTTDNFISTSMLLDFSKSKFSALFLFLLGLVFVCSPLRFVGFCVIICIVFAKGYQTLMIILDLVKFVMKTVLYPYHMRVDLNSWFLDTPHNARVCHHNNKRTQSEHVLVYIPR